MDDNTVDLTVTSPPYDKLRFEEEYEYDFDFPAIADSLYRVTKVGGVVVWVVDDQIVDGSHTGTSFRQALYFLDETGFLLHDTMIYRKRTVTFPDSNRYFNGFEYMFVFSKDGAPKTVNLIEDRKNRTPGKVIHGERRQPDGTKERVNNEGDCHPEISRRFNVWEYATGLYNSTSDEEAFEHPAIFPEKLAADHIISWSDKGDLVYDPFTGSGTTQKMAERLSRKWIGSEYSEKFCELTRQRVKREADQHKLF